MPSVFKVDAKDVSQLTDLQLTQPLKMLLYLEAITNGIVQTAVDVGLEIQVADGGEDGRIRWSDDPTKTDYLPSHFVQFQNKATNMGPTACANELVPKDGKLKAMLAEAMKEGADYVLFPTQPLNKRQKRERVNKIVEKLHSLDVTHRTSANVHIYDAGTIEGWVNNYVPAITAVLNWTGRPLVEGLKTWADWDAFERHPLMYRS